MPPRPGDLLDIVAATNALRFAGFIVGPREFPGLPTYQNSDDGPVRWLWSDLLLWAQQQKRRDEIQTRVIDGPVDADDAAMSREQVAPA
jgi:hypothetical protein